MGKGGRYTQEQILKAIKGSGAIMSTIAQRLGCHWDTAYKYCNKTKATQQALKNEREFIKDLSESTLIESIKNGDIQSAKWYLSKKAKDRDYGDEMQVETKGSSRIELVINDADIEPRTIDDTGAVNEN